ncbi:Hypothetical protein AA314_00459 [Archangium gephyra]|uniref:Uncharacterized protein n=1 Tax=Archangium gephyra TaxID=48 RepID=A0AAC8Q0P3_9BACT|nr:Hypothetical protein AA314_00459 [Archangium gephyra]
MPDAPRRSEDRQPHGCCSSVPRLVCRAGPVRPWLGRARLRVYSAPGTCLSASCSRDEASRASGWATSPQDWDSGCVASR